MTSEKNTFATTETCIIKPV